MYICLWWWWWWWYRNVSAACWGKVVDLFPKAIPYTADEEVGHWRYVTGGLSGSCLGVIGGLAGSCRRLAVDLRVSCLVCLHYFFPLLQQCEECKAEQQKENEEKKAKKEVSQSVHHRSCPLTTKSMREVTMNNCVDSTELALWSDRLASMRSAPRSSSRWPSASCPIHPTSSRLVVDNLLNSLDRQWWVWGSRSKC
jgi:hypothetical protein